MEPKRYSIVAEAIMPDKNGMWIKFQDCLECRQTHDFQVMSAEIQKQQAQLEVRTITGSPFYKRPRLAMIVGVLIGIITMVVIRWLSK